MGILCDLLRHYSALVCCLLSAPLQAQVRGQRGGPEFTRGQRQANTLDNGTISTASNYQLTQTTAAITPGSTQVTGFNCGSSPPGDDCMATVTLPFAFTLYDLDLSHQSTSVLTATRNS